MRTVAAVAAAALHPSIDSCHFGKELSLPVPLHDVFSHSSHLSNINTCKQCFMCNNDYKGITTKTTRESPQKCIMFSSDESSMTSITRACCTSRTAAPGAPATLTIKQAELPNSRLARSPKRDTHRFIFRPAVAAYNQQPQQGEVMVCVEQYEINNKGCAPLHGCHNMARGSCCLLQAPGWLWPTANCPRSWAYFFDNVTRLMHSSCIP